MHGQKEMMRIVFQRCESVLEIETSRPGVDRMHLDRSDANLDGEVNQLDINKVLANWQATGATWAANGDVTEDGVVNQLDINAILGNWQAVAEPQEPAGIPEPATIGLLLIGGLALLKGRR
ncbi:hypothetical protein LCGC14_2672720 [marine sediment metagenome]|uniref:Dockerin domain-containing protein n=1 Tax=marine sediment metagenome TaxID=412755 RepID=A0A0F9CFL5_9ZZZZ